MWPQLSTPDGDARSLWKMRSKESSTQWKRCASFHECQDQPTGSRVYSTAGNRPGDFESALTQRIWTEQSRHPTTTLGLWRRFTTDSHEPQCSPCWMPATAIGLSRLIKSQVWRPPSKAISVGTDSCDYHSAWTWAMTCSGKGWIISYINAQAPSASQMM